MNDSSTTTRGFEIVCPDGALRHMPYYSWDMASAEINAQAYSDGLYECLHWDPAFAGARQCPGGPHKIRQCKFENDFVKWQASRSQHSGAT